MNRHEIPMYSSHILLAKILVYLSHLKSFRYTYSTEQNQDYMILQVYTLEQTFELLQP